MRRVVVALLTAAFGTAALIGAKAYSAPATPLVVADAPLDPAQTTSAADGDPDASLATAAPSAVTTAPNANGTVATTIPPPAPPPAASTARTIVGIAVPAKNYGSVQVQVVMTGSHIDDVQVLKMSNRPLNAPAKLRQEALTKQSAQLTNVSGATYTSQAYMQSLQSALATA